MELEYSRNKELAQNILKQIIQGIDLISIWNKDIKSPDNYLASPEGMQKLAATCMLIESIGEGVKKIDTLLPDFLSKTLPDVPWKQIKGMRDRIAHGYFNIDAEIIFDVV